MSDPARSSPAGGKIVPAAGAPAAPKVAPLPPRPPPPPLPVAKSSAVVLPEPVSTVPHLNPKRCPSCEGRYPEDFNVCPRDATPLERVDASGDPFVGKVLGDAYKIERLVGEGGMGRVYEARHLRLPDRRFAVKILHPELARQTDVVARFQREAQSASSIAHPNVIDVFDVHRTPDGVPYMVGEFLEGEELGAYLKRVGRLEVPVAVGIVRQVCRALSAAHARGIVHRDMKPENVFIVQQGDAATIKVIDFGISKAGSRDKTLTRTGMIMGTPSYMAPEQARGDKVDHRADVYAIGALLYQALTGQRPFDSEDPGTVLSMVLTEEPARPRSLVSTIPEALELVIQRAMAKDPLERYQSTEELDAALAPFDVTGGPAPALVVQADPTSLTATPGPVNVTARTVIAAGGSTTHPTLQTHIEAGKDARRARPTIVLTSLGLIIWLLGGLVDALAGVVRYFRDGELTSTEAVMLIVGCVFAVFTPGLLFILRVRKNVWPNSVKAVELASDLRRTASAAFVTYGAAAILGRAALTVILRDASTFASGLWDAGLFGASVVGAALAGGVGPLARRIRRRRLTL